MFNIEKQKDKKSFKKKLSYFALTLFSQLCPHIDQCMGQELRSNYLRVQEASGEISAQHRLLATKQERMSNYLRGQEASDSEKFIYPSMEGGIGFFAPKIKPYPYDWEYKDPKGQIQAAQAMEDNDRDCFFGTAEEFTSKKGQENLRQKYQWKVE